MAIQTQFRRGNSYSHSLFTGASGEITVDLDKKTAVVHDGATVGGFPLALSSYTAAAYNQANAAVSIAQLAFNAANVDLNYTVAGVTGDVSNIQLAAGISSSGLLTTANVSELNNLYYTNARVYAAVTGNLALKANITDLTTANVAELTNLYYTNTRVYANVTERLVNLDTNVIPAVSEVYSLGSPTRKFKDLYLSGNTIILGNTTISSTTDGLTVDSIRANVWNGLYTANVVETADSLYYTNARVYAAVTGNLALKANVVDLTTANVAESAGNLYFTVARANAAIDSRVTRQYVEDLGITSNANNANTANSALTANVSNTVTSISNFTTSDLAEGSNLYFSNARSRAAISVTGKGAYDSGIGTISINAANVSVSSTAPTNPFVGDVWINADTAEEYLYFSDGTSFQWAEISAAGTGGSISSTYGDSNVILLGYATNANVALKANVIDLTTANVTEATNLYFTNARAVASLTAGQSITIDANGRINSTATGGSSTYGDSNVQLLGYATNANVALKANVADLKTANVAELTNLYFTNARAIAAVTNTTLSNLTVSGNVTATNFVGNITITGNVVGTSANVSLVAGAYTATFDNSGNLTIPGNISATGTFVGNGSGLTGVALKTTGSWTVTTGTNTYSFTVPASGTYQLWVDCNIPNGILAWNATATITNTNVPVVGAHYAWVYNGGGSPVDFTSIPNQFIGTSNTIVRSSVAPSSTTNRFDFGINNSSGGNITVRYGWVTIG